MLTKSESRLNKYLTGLEKKHQPIVYIGLISFVLFIILLFTTRLDPNCRYLGRYYELLANNPFDYSYNNPVAFRILTPLISFLLGLKGKGIIITNLLITYIFIGVIFGYYKNQLGNNFWGLFVTLAGITSLALSTSVHCGGYADILTYLIIFLIWVKQHNRWYFLLLFGLSLFNRESIIFLLPWFLLLYFKNHHFRFGDTIQLMIGLLIIFVLYYLFRSHISAHQEIKYSLSYYLDPILNKPFDIFLITVKFHMLGFLSVLRFLWAVPLLAIYYYFSRKENLKGLSIVLIIILSYLQLFIAQDTSRMFTLSYIVLFLPIVDLYNSNFLKFKRWFPILVLLNLIAPQIYTAGHNIEIWHNFLIRLLSDSFI